MSSSMYLSKILLQAMHFVTTLSNWVKKVVTHTHQILLVWHSALYPLWPEGGVTVTLHTIQQHGYCEVSSLCHTHLPSCPVALLISINRTPNATKTLFDLGVISILKNKIKQNKKTHT